MRAQLEDVVTDDVAALAEHPVELAQLDLGGAGGIAPLGLLRWLRCADVAHTAACCNW